MKVITSKLLEGGAESIVDIEGPAVLFRRVLVGAVNGKTTQKKKYQEKFHGYNILKGFPSECNIHQGFKGE